MALAFTVDSIDTVPEAQRSLYKQVGEKFTLDVDGYEDPVGLKSALTKERESVKTATREAQAWRALGKTPDEIAALVEAQAQSDRDKLEKGGAWDKLKAQMAEQQKVELGKKDERITTLTKSLEKRLIDADAITAITSAKGSAALLLPHVRASVKVIEENGDFKVQVVDDAGNPRVNGKGEFLSITDLVSEMRQSDSFGRAFEPSGITGSGATGSASGVAGKTMKKTAFDALKPAERAKAMQGGMVIVD